MTFIKSLKELKKNIKDWETFLKNNGDYIPTIGNMFYILKINNRFINDLKEHKITTLEKDREEILNIVSDLIEEMYAKFWDRAINSKKQINFNLISQYSRVYQTNNTDDGAIKQDIKITITPQNENVVDLDTIKKVPNTNRDETKTIN